MICQYCLLIILIFAAKAHSGADEKKAPDIKTQPHFDSRNYASAECAKVVETNPEAKKSSLIITESKDEYMLNPCKAKIWFVIELCEKIQARQIEIVNYELFSSTPKDFTVYFSDIFPTNDWNLVGNLTAKDTRSLQTFNLTQIGFGKFIRVELHSHHRNEQYCPISQVKIYGISMVDEYEIINNEELPNKPTLNETIMKIPKRRTSPMKVYMNMMLDPKACGLSRDLISDSGLMKKVVNNDNQLQPFTPNQNKTIAPLKPSIFVELSNKFKKLELTVMELKSLNAEMERRLNETERKLQKSELLIRNNPRYIVIILNVYLVYKLMLSLM